MYFAKVNTKVFQKLPWKELLMAFKVTELPWQRFVLLECCLVNFLVVNQMEQYVQFFV